MAATYQVINKHHTRATYRTQVVLDRHGNQFEMLHAGEPTRYEVGALLDDLTAAELAAFPDRFQLISGEPLALVRQHGQAAPKLNPELYAMLGRSYKGDASADEQALVHALIGYLTQPEPTAEETATMQDVVHEYGLPLFV